MKKFFVVGLGNFGFNISRTLMENSCEVLGIDSKREVVQYAKDYISHAVIGDASDRAVLESLSISDFDAAIISLGQDMASSILIALHLKEIGMSRIVVRAVSEDHGKVLKMIGVNDVVFPEKDMAVRIANRLALKNAMDYLPISDEYGIVEVDPPESFIGKSLRDLMIASRFSCQVIGLKFPGGNGDPGDLSGKNVNFKIAPSADDRITPGTVLVVIGKLNDIDRLRKSS
ncbi:MAG: TrkA family potassium uptake protein [Chrysiogenales bacterium]|nr:MAG: TrkA family potassium uptake protein [Chrysiogenales bacterium]